MLEEVPEVASDDCASLPASFSGLYNHPAYGDYILCPPPHSDFTSSSACARADDLWYSVKNASVALSSTPPAFGVALDADVMSYIQLLPTQSSKMIFSMAAFEVTTTPSYSSAPVEKVVYPQFDAAGPNIEFSLGEDGKVEGFGMFEIFGAGNYAPPLKGKTVKERAEVWFDRID